jgi:hypothetical protein
MDNFDLKKYLVENKVTKNSCLNEDNNKQSMKVYTEEQVRKAIELSRDTHPEGRGYMQREEYDYSDDEVIDLLTPIELPSDLVNGLNEGAKWMRDKIQGGNK